MENGLQSMDMTIAPENRESLDTFSSFAETSGASLREVGGATARGPDGSITDRETLFRLAISDPERSP
jgi:hypothetical protein